MNGGRSTSSGLLFRRSNSHDHGSTGLSTVVGALLGGVTEATLSSSRRKAPIFHLQGLALLVRMT